MHLHVFAMLVSKVTEACAQHVPLARGAQGMDRSAASVLLGRGCSLMEDSLQLDVLTVHWTRTELPPVGWLLPTVQAVLQVVKHRAVAQQAGRSACVPPRTKGNSQQTAGSVLYAL